MPRNLSIRGTRRATFAGVLAVLAVACDRSSPDRRRSQNGDAVAADSLGVSPKEIRTVRLNAPRELVENSAAAMSRTRAGMFFTINDSGNEPLLFALDTTGANRGVWRVLGATNVDWESAAVGPCVVKSSTTGRDDCVYIGDTGDNNARHATRVIYRVNEPAARDGRDTIRARGLRYVYADGPHDVEAMYVWRTGDIFLITKRPLVDRAGRRRPALVFMLPVTAWDESGRATAQLVDSLPIVPGSALMRLITDAALSPDLRHLAVRTYTQAYIFAIDERSGRVDHAVAPAVCNLVRLRELQGEGLTWADNRGRLVFTSEGVNVPIHIATCPMP